MNREPACTRRARVLFADIGQQGGLQVESSDAQNRNGGVSAKEGLEVSRCTHGARLSCPTSSSEATRERAMAKCIDAPEQHDRRRQPERPGEDRHQRRPDPAQESEPDRSRQQKEREIRKQPTEEVRSRRHDRPGTGVLGERGHARHAGWAQHRRARRALLARERAAPEARERRGALRMRGAAGGRDVGHGARMPRRSTVTSAHGAAKARGAGRNRRPRPRLALAVTPR